jgi:hypothetical protein
MAKKKGTIRKITGEELKKMKQGPLRHTELDPFLTAWARSLYERAGYTMYAAFEQWELGFMRDTNPHLEMMTWECIARATEAYLTEHPDKESKEIVSPLTAISMGAEFKQETDETRDLRNRFRRIHDSIADDIEGTLSDIEGSLDYGTNLD